MIVRIICDLIFYHILFLLNPEFVSLEAHPFCRICSAQSLFCYTWSWWVSVPERVHFLRICFCPSPRLKKSQEQDWYRCTKWHMFWCNFPERSYVYPPGYAGLEPRRIKSESNGKPGGDLSSSVWHVTISNVNGSVLELEMNLRQVLSFTITEKAPTRT